MRGILPFKSRARREFWSMTRAATDISFQDMHGARQTKSFGQLQEF